MTGYRERYRGNQAYFGAEPNRFLLDHLDRVVAGGRVLDIGIGQGRNGLPLARLGFRVTGIDSSPDAIATTGDAARAEGLSVELWQGSFVDFEPPERFDALLLFGVLQELPRPLWSELFDRLGRWTAPGGLLFVTAWHVGDPRYRKYAAAGVALAEHSFEVPGVGVRSFLAPGEIAERLADWRLLHHFEGLGPPHHHGDGRLEQHGDVEVVAVRE